MVRNAACAELFAFATVRFFIHKLFLEMQKGKNGFNQFAAG